MKLLHFLFAILCLAFTQAFGQSMVPVGFDISNPLGVEVDASGDPYVISGGTGNNDGSVIRYNDDFTSDIIVTGLPSFFNQETQDLQSALNIYFVSDRQFYVVIGGGPGVGFGSLALFDTDDFYEKGDALTLADARRTIAVSAWVLEQGYAESNPYSMLETEEGALLIADAAANAVFRFHPDSGLSVFADIPSTPNPLPFGPPVMEPVPTKILAHPDGGYLISSFTGFPFATGGANIYRLTASGEVSEYASGLTLITDIAFDYDGSLMVLQFANFGPMGFEFGSAQLIKISDGGDQEVIAAGFGPSAGLGIAQNGNIYASHLFLGQLLELERCIADAGELSIPTQRASTSICVGDGISDNISFRVNNDKGVSQLAITDADGYILALPDDYTIDFEETEPGECQVYNISAGTSVGGLEVGGSIGSLTGCYAISNAITLDRQECMGCHTPLNLRYRQQGYGAYTIQWDKVRDATSYQVIFSEVDNPNNTYSLILRSSRVRIIDSGNRNLNILVRALCGSGGVSDFALIIAKPHSKKSRDRDWISEEDGDIHTVSFKVLLETNFYPNPASDLINVSLSEPLDNGIIRMFDLKGQMIQRKKALTGSLIQRVDLSNLASGMYFLSITSDTRAYLRKKIIVTK